jgi:hypothetical protein
MLRGLIPRNIRIETIELEHGRCNGEIETDRRDQSGRSSSTTPGMVSGRWRGNILTCDAAYPNAGELSVFVMMTCLNGFFQDAADSLAESC